MTDRRCDHNTTTSEIHTTEHSGRCISIELCGGCETTISTSLHHVIECKGDA